MDELQAVLTDAFAHLAEGAADPASLWRHPALATAHHPDGLAWPVPGIRTVVLRRAAPDARWVEFHTDRRSPKMAALAQNPRAALHWWAPAQRVQMRLDGAIAIADAAATDAAWAILSPASRATYGGALAPGTPIAAPSQAGRPSPPDAAAHEVFTVLRLHFDALDYLSLARGDNRRAGFRWPDGQLHATWLAP